MRSCSSGLVTGVRLRAAVVTLEKALLWTDGRYYAQAAQELSEEWTLMKDRLPETPSIEVWRATTRGVGRFAQR